MPFHEMLSRDRKAWDFRGVPPEKYPLLPHFHPLVIYRHQVIKQADVVLAMLLLGDEFSSEQKRRNFDFYDPLTTGDSSLSVSVQSILAYELGYLDKAREYVRYALLMDLADVAANVEQGCHIASMGGTWRAMVYGAAGLRDHEGRVTFDPRLGRKVKGMRFNLAIRGCRLSVHIDQQQDRATCELRQGRGLSIVHQGQELTLKPGEPATLPIVAP